MSNWNQTLNPIPVSGTFSVTGLASSACEMIFPDHPQEVTKESEWFNCNGWSKPKKVPIAEQDPYNHEPYKIRPRKRMRVDRYS